MLLFKIRLLVEEGLNELPYTTMTVTTPAGCDYEGVKYIKGICGVSIMRSGMFFSELNAQLISQDQKVASQKKVATVKSKFEF